MKVLQEALFQVGGARRWLLFVNWYECCNGKDSTYEIRVGMAETPRGPFLDQVDRALNQSQNMFQI